MSFPGSLKISCSVSGLLISVHSSPAKLKELNDGAPQEHKLSEEILENLEKLLASVCETNSSNSSPTIQQVNLLWKASHWPEGNNSICSVTDNRTLN